MGFFGGTTVNLLIGTFWEALHGFYDPPAPTSLPNLVLNVFREERLLSVAGFL